MQKNLMAATPYPQMNYNGSNSNTVFPSSSARNQYNAIQIYDLSGKAHNYVLCPISQKFPQHCLWNSSNVCLIDEGPLLPFQAYAKVVVQQVYDLSRNNFIKSNCPWLPARVAAAVSMVSLHSHVLFHYTESSYRYITRRSTSKI